MKRGIADKLAWPKDWKRRYAAGQAVVIEYGETSRLAPQALAGAWRESGARSLCLLVVIPQDVNRITLKRELEPLHILCHVVDAPHMRVAT